MRLRFHIAMRLVLGGTAVAGLPALLAAQEPDDNPRLRWEFFYQKRAYPFARIPAGALARARLQRLSMASRLGGAPAPMSTTIWTSIGPRGIPINLTSIGRLTAIAVHPNRTMIYVGGAQGGVWKSTDAGANWTPLTDDQCSLAMGALAIDPVNPDIVYAGTGEQHFSGDSYYGCGVLRSPDGGTSWTQLGGSIFQTTQGGAKISRIVIDPRGAGTPATTRILVASDFGLYRSTNGGGAFTSVLSGVITDLVLNPANPDILYAAVRGVGIFKSVNNGVAWTPQNTGFAGSSVRINLAIAPSAPDTLYASVERPGVGDLLGIWRSINAAASWSQATATGASCASQCWYDQHIYVAPNNSATVYFGGFGLYKSTDAATSFTEITGPIHVDQHALAFDPVDPQTVYVGNDGGVFRTVNGGTSWTTLNSNLAITQFYEGISFHPFDKNQAMGGTQDNGTLSWTGLPGWDHVIGGDGGYTAIDPSATNVRYGETQWSTNSGFSGPRRSDGGSFTLKLNGINTGESALFIPPLVLDQARPSTLYFGTVRVYQTTNRGDVWTAFSPDLATPGRISVIAPAVGDPKIVYVGTSNGQVFVTRDAGQTWLPRSIPTSGARFVQAIAVDPRDPLTAYVTVSGFLTPHVFRTTNAGVSFANVTGNLPDAPVNAVVVDPTSRGTVIVGTDVGVFSSPDSGGGWTPLGVGLPNVAVYDLAYNSSTGLLIAGTHGRGMFTLDVIRPLTLAVVAGAGVDTVNSGSTAPRPDSGMVVLAGTGHYTAAWTATHGAAAWLTLNTANGSGTAALHWARDPTALAPGLYVDTIRVTAAGAASSPVEIVDSLFVRSSLTVALDAAVHRDSAAVGSTALRADSAVLSVTGVGADTTSWFVTSGAAAWLALTATTGAGSDTIRWTRNPTGLAPGAFGALLTIQFSNGQTATIADTLAMYRPLTLSDTVRITGLVAGTAAPRLDSSRVVLRGVGNTTATWTVVARRGDPWLTLTNAGGTGDGMIRWTLSAGQLLPGTYRDTLVVATSRGDSARVATAFSLSAPGIQLSCVVSELLRGGCLDETRQRYLDIVGNQDGVFNLGDFVALMRGGAAARQGAGQ